MLELYHHNIGPRYIDICCIVFFRPPRESNPSLWPSTSSSPHGEDCLADLVLLEQLIVLGVSLAQGPTYLLCVVQRDRLLDKASKQVFVFPQHLERRLKVGRYSALTELEAEATISDLAANHSLLLV